MTEREWWGRAAKAALARLLLAVLLIVPGAAFSEDRTQLFVTKEENFGRLVFTFPDRLDLPPYKIRNENGVLAVEFEEPIDLALPDVAVTLPDYVTIARVDPDRKGVRFGMRNKVNLHRLEAGERLFIDLLPPDWQGLPPGLPPQVIADLSERAKKAAEVAAQSRKAEQARLLNPIPTVRVGRNATFLRIQFDWSVAAQGWFTLEDGVGHIDFDWPVPVDLYPLKSDMPAEIVEASNSVSAAGSRVTLKLAEGIVPRFYQTSEQQFIIDIDVAHERSDEAKTLEELAKLMPASTGSQPHTPEAVDDSHDGPEQAEITPTISSIGHTVRMTYPFDRDTAAAVFRRGNTVWMMFDTGVTIHPPEEDETLHGVASGFAVQSEGDTRIVRLDLDSERLATLGSEGRAWVLSLGDVLLNPTEALPLNRRRNAAGEFEIVADVQRPSRVHAFRDPLVGDELTVVTSFPPARGVSRPLSYVDFDALPSIQGLVIRPEHESLEVDLIDRQAVIRTVGGLTLSPFEQARTADLGLSAQRSTFVDLAGQREDDGDKFASAREALMGKAAAAEGPARDAARLDLARFYLANRFGQEALGVLQVTLAELKAEDLRKKARLSLGIALTLSYRSLEAIETLSSPAIAEEVDATLWRTIARVQVDDFAPARLDALAAETVIDGYPVWVRQDFLFAAVRAAVETNDTNLAQHFLGMLEFAKLDPEQVTLYQLFSARIAEASGRDEEALDGYGQVIAAEVRPTRAEAVFRTLLLLDKLGRLDLGKATRTLSAEVLLWRGDRLESLMQQFLADLYFRHHDYREGFATVKEAVQYFPESASSAALLGEAQGIFSNLFLDGGADALPPVDALSLYYDFRELTPPGARGDEMIRNLARRLVDVDLLTQAGDLLDYQITNRLKGAAQAQVAADLAVIRLADRNPEAALRALNRSRLVDLPPTLERQRRVLEARALIDANRQDLALDLLRTMTGRDADLLRIDGMWKSKQYQAASELIEVTYSPDDPTDTLNPAARMNIVKAAVGFVLADDKLGLSRLRSKFGARLAQSPEWPLFDFVTSDVTRESPEFRKLAREVSGLDSLDAFIGAYKQIYGGAGDPLPRKSLESAG